MAKKIDQKHLNSKTLAAAEHGQTYRFDDIDDLDLVVRENYRTLDEGHVERLIESIREVGCLEAVTLAVEVRDGKRSLYCVDGDHRIEAVSRLRKLARSTGEAWRDRPIPAQLDVVEGKGNELRNALRSVTANALNKRENVLDRAGGIRRLKDAGLQNQRIATLLGVDRKSVERGLQVAELTLAVKDVIHSRLDDLKESFVYELARNRSQFASGGLNGAELDAALIKVIESELSKKSEPKKLKVAKKNNVAGVAASEFEAALARLIEQEKMPTKWAERLREELHFS